ncbi:MAG: sulfur reduction protein DsrE [Christiangramia sp.]|uniref:DsrE family protein n=1 Tax=Christiangramia sp. TaxID=1931228 RepID=UPI0032420BBE
MKSISKIIAIIGLILFSGIQANAQNAEIQEHNYVVLTKKVPQLKPILLTAEDLREEDGDHFGQFEVIVCGKTVEELTDAETMTPFLQQAKELGVIINACGFSLKKFEVDASKLPEGIKVVKNGILYDFQLQKKGFMSLGL